MINISTYTTYPHRGNNKLYVLQLKAATENRYTCTCTVLRLLAVLALDLHYRTRGTHAHTHLSYTFSVYDWIIIIQRLPRRTSLNDDVIQLLQDVIAQTT